jgi:hypothetical protein
MASTIIEASRYNRGSHSGALCCGGRRSLRERRQIYTVGRARLLPSFLLYLPTSTSQSEHNRLLVNGRWRPEKAPQERRPPEDRKRTSKKMFRAVGAPVLLTLYPESYPVDAGQIAHACELNDSNVTQVIYSPKRQELVKRLTAGHSAVWILLESGDQAKDDAATKALESQLQLDAQWLALPTPEELEIKPQVLESAKIKLRIEFSVLRVRRDDPQEAFLIDCLLNSEPDLHSFNEPLAFPVFGRGRVLYALVGKGIASNTIRAASSFMVGPCSCQVKEQNPGFDLLLQCDWPTAIGETFISSPLPEAGQAEPRQLKIPAGRTSR